MYPNWTYFLDVWLFVWGPAAAACLWPGVLLVLPFAFGPDDDFVAEAAEEDDDEADEEFAGGLYGTKSIEAELMQ